MLTLFNTYKIVTSGEGRTIAPLDSRTTAQNQMTNNSGANFPNSLPQQSQTQNAGVQLQSMQQGMPDIPKTGINFAAPKKILEKYYQHLLMSMFLFSQIQEQNH